MSWAFLIALAIIVVAGLVGMRGKGGASTYGPPRASPG